MSVVLTKMKFKNFPDLSEEWTDIDVVATFVANGAGWTRDFIVAWRFDEPSDDVMKVDLVPDYPKMWVSFAEMDEDRSGYIEVFGEYRRATADERGRWMYTPVEGGLVLTDQQNDDLLRLIGRKTDALIIRARRAARDAYEKVRDDNRIWTL